MYGVIQVWALILTQIALRERVSNVKTSILKSYFSRNPFSMLKADSLWKSEKFMSAKPRKAVKTGVH